MLEVWGRRNASNVRLDAHLANRTHIVDDRLTMADIPYGPLAHRYFQLDVARPDLPNLKMWYERLCKRPAYKTHVMFEYGNTPAEWYMRERGLPVEGKGPSQPCKPRRIVEGVELSATE